MKNKSTSTDNSTSRASQLQFQSNSPTFHSKSPAFSYFLHLSPLKLARPPIPISLPDEFIDLGPFVGLLSVNQDQSLS